MRSADDIHDPEFRNDPLIPMFSTVVLVAVFVCLLLASVVLWALFLRLGLHWANVPDVTTARVALTAATVIILQVASNLLFLSVSPASDAQSIVLGSVQLAAAVIVPCTVIRIVFKTRILSALQAWLPTLLTTVTTVVFSFLVLRPFLFEAFVDPTNAMAPTLLGRHWEGTCSECGQPNYCTARDGRDATAGPSLMICDDFHVTEASDVDKTVHSGDRFLVAKFLTAQRWDLVIFQSPEDRTTLWVKRLVGFPGEKIHFQDGFVWIDDEKQTPPDSIHGIEYLSALPDWPRREFWGSTDRPALLGSEEYFVLGDFSVQSKDSRFWQHGAPGHNPYAVPESYVKGVITHTHWPPHRWRIHR